MNCKIAALLEVLPMIPALTGQDCLIGLCDTQTCIGLWEANKSISDLCSAINIASKTSEELVNQAEKVSTLVKGIAETASKSNMLALNASIEAARAGFEAISSITANISTITDASNKLTAFAANQ